MKIEGSRALTEIINIEIKIIFGLIFILSVS